MFVKNLCNETLSKTNFPLGRIKVHLTLSYLILNKSKCFYVGVDMLVKAPIQYCISLKERFKAQSIRELNCSQRQDRSKVMVAGVLTFETHYGEDTLKIVAFSKLCTYPEQCTYLPANLKEDLLHIK